jgi:hypothetical protein
VKPRTFQKLFGRRPGRVGPGGHRYRVPIVLKPDAPLPPEALHHFWYPGRFGVEQAPDWFVDRLLEISDQVMMVRPPANAPLWDNKPRPWLMWMKKATVTYWLCPGWSLLFIWADDLGDPQRLDNRVFANLYLRSKKKFGNGLKYYEHCQKTQANAKAARVADFDAENKDRAESMRQFHQIKNIGRGNKFALHHDGTLLPSRAQRQWMKDTRKTRLPSAVRRDLERQRDVRGR